MCDKVINKKYNVLIINGPNMSCLEDREACYGGMSLQQIQQHTNELMDGHGLTPQFEVVWFQSEYEAEIVKRIHQASKEKQDIIIINPAALSHTSMAVRDALSLCSPSVTVVEVHLTSPRGREKSRHTLLTAGGASIIIEGLGPTTYFSALYGVMTKMN